MKMKYFAVLLLSTHVSGQDWTCDECAEGGAALGAFASSESAIASQVDILLAELCPQAEDPVYCTENLPEFWGMLSPTIFPVHFSFICDDMEECKTPPQKDFVPACPACSARVNSATDALAWEETITAWVTGLQNDGFCSSFDAPDECKEGVAFVIPLALPILANAPRDWVDTFCGDVWGCQ